MVNDTTEYPPLLRATSGQYPPRPAGISGGERTVEERGRGQNN